MSRKKDFKAFSDALCTAMMYKSAKIKFRHIGNFLYGDPKSRSRAAANLAYTLLKWSLMNLSPHASDLFLEFGVANGNSINITAVLRARLTQSPPHPVYGFDSFWGLPVNWVKVRAGYERGAFSRNGSQPQVEVGMQLVQGLVEVTLSVFLAEHPATGERKLHGDEEMKALHQLMLESKLKLQLLPFRDNHGESAVFRVLAV
ncbi:hypothetical protein B484DRAFT_400986 [Ochromonadaceae sp. CCMP2298]|nr:hypothetical protein B484DRAFT_400986 [Ochromonadaceae sp. CCMP2298]